MRKLIWHLFLLALLVIVSMAVLGLMFAWLLL
jgi:hypothetical protein